MAVGEVTLRPCFSEEHVRVNLKSLIQSKEGWGAADVSIQQKILRRFGIQSIDDPLPSPRPISTIPLRTWCVSALLGEGNTHQNGDQDAG